MRYHTQTETTRKRRIYIRSLRRNDKKKLESSSRWYLQFSLYLRMSDLVLHATFGQFKYWETRGFRKPRNTAFMYRWKLNTARTGNGVFVKSKVRRRKLATSREIAGPITIGNHLSDSTPTARDTSFHQTETNQTKPKSERLGTDQPNQAHPQLAKRQTYLIQLLARAGKRGAKREREDMWQTKAIEETEGETR